MLFVKFLFFALACCLLNNMLAAQTIEYELPTEYNLVPGRLSVTFADSVSEDQALTMLVERSYEVEASRFTPVMVLARLADSLSADQEAFLRDAKSVQSFEAFRPIPDPLPDGVTSSPYMLHVSFHSTTPEAEATSLLVQIDGLRIQSVRSLPKEMTVVVPVGREEDAEAILAALPGVRYVSYLMADVDE